MRQHLPVKNDFFVDNALLVCNIKSNEFVTAIRYLIRYNLFVIPYSLVGQGHNLCPTFIIMSITKAS